MNRFVLDTDHLSLLYRGDEAVSNGVAGRDPSAVAISIVSVEETLSGWYTLLRRAKHPGDLSRA
jgi:tRNA(fMet)-specific endonuclease VapC